MLVHFYLFILINKNVMNIINNSGIFFRRLIIPRPETILYFLCIKHLAESQWMIVDHNLSKSLTKPKYLFLKKMTFLIA